MKIKRFLLVLLCALHCIAFWSEPATAADDAKKNEWVIYSTEVGWLRVGTQAEYEAAWQKKDEINGGTSEEPLKKSLLAQGFSKREDAVKSVCEQLTRVQLHIVPPAAGGPVRYLTGVFRFKPYSLRLTPGFDQETAETMAKTGKFYKALEYDFDEELKTVRKYGITPRHNFNSKQWLVHSIGHGSVQGPVKEDRWMCVTSEPGKNEKSEAIVVLADGFGGTITHGIKEAEGPFLDNYTLAKVMKKYGVEEVNLWPPVTSAVGRDVQPRVKASEIPDEPKDFGAKALPMQPVMPNRALEDWVVYLVEDRWLHVSTRYEFKQPLLKREVLWAGTGEEPAKKQLLSPPENGKEVFYSRKQALRQLVGELTAISYDFQPLNQPREPLTALYRGKKVHLKLERGGDPDATVEYKSLGYDVPGNIRALREVDTNITPRKTFRQQWLVHATGHGTYNGPVKDDHWMMITSAPNAANRSFVIPDGTGGTFTYSYDKALGPFEDSYKLVAALRDLSKQDPRVKSVGLYGEDRGVSVDDIPENITPVDFGRPTRAGSIKLHKLWPPSAIQGQSVGVHIIGKNIETGCRLALGNGIVIKDAVYRGRDADSQFDQWWATAEIDSNAPLGQRALMVYNIDGGFGTLPKAFEVTQGSGDLCPPFEMIIPANAAAWINAATSDEHITDDLPDKERPALIKKLQARRDELFGALAAMETAREHRKDYADKVRRILSELTSLDVQTDSEEYRKRVIEAKALQKLMREEETTYAKGMTYLSDAFNERETERFLVTLRERARCLNKRAREALNEARNWNYVAYWNTWRLKKYLYDVQKDDLLHTLKIWQIFNSGRQGKLLQQIDDARRAQIAERGQVDTAALRPLQRLLRDVHLDMGVCGLLYTQAMVEDGLMGQDSYLASSKGTTQQAQGIELATELRGQAEQSIIFGLKYTSALGADGFTTITDSAKRIFNAGLGELSGKQFETLGGGITKALEDSREKADLSLVVMERIRGYSDEQTIALRTRDISKDKGMEFLDKDYHFFLQTSGGLGRLAACYNATFEETMADEYAITIERAKRAATDMRRTFNAVRGADADDDFTAVTNVPWRKFFTSPFGLMKSLIQHSPLAGDHFTGTEAYIQNRENEAKEMQNLLPWLQRVGWEPLKLREVAPKTYGFYLWLRQNNPYMLEWELTRDHLLTNQRLDQIERLIKLAADEIDREQVATLNEFKQRNLHQLGARRPAEMARLHQLQACDRLMLWDYDGALESFYQAAEISEVLAREERVAAVREGRPPKRVEIQPRANVEWLRTQLNVKKTQEARLDVVVALADSVFWQRMYQGMGELAFKHAHRIGLVRHRLPKTSPKKPPLISAWADAIWNAVNPFSTVIAAVGVEREWAAIGKAIVGIGSVASQDLATQVTKATILEWLPVKQEYADFLANAIVNTATHQSGEADGAQYDTLIVEVARGLKHQINRYRAGEISVAADRARGQARRSLSNHWTYHDWLREHRALTENHGGKSLVGKSDQEIHQATQAIADAENKVQSVLQPLDADMARGRLKEINDIPATPEKQGERLAKISEFFKQFPITEHGGPVRDMIKKLRKEKHPEVETLNTQIDELRWEVLTTAMQDFLTKNPQHKALFYYYVFIGAAANKAGKAYRDKKAMTDVDFTAFLKETATNSQRKEFETAFNDFFEKTYKISLGHLDMSVMGDYLPVFYPQLESTTALLFTREPEKLKALKEVLERDAEKIRIDAFHKERYYELGNILFLNLGLKIVGNLKKGERTGNDMANDSPEETAKIFSGLQLESWMAFDVVMGQLGFLMRHKELAVHEKSGEPLVDDKGNFVLQDPMAYHKYLCKYPGSRGLFGALLLSSHARKRLTTITKEDATRHGWESMEEVVVHVAKEIMEQHGFGELGLPLVGTKVATHEHYAAMFDMWLLSKSGAKPEVVAARSLATDAEWKLKGNSLHLNADDPRINTILAEHTKKTEGFLRQLISRSLITQATDLKKLEHAAADARKEGTPEGLLRAQVLEGQMKRIFFRLASTWFRMKREVQGQVLRETMEWVLKEVPAEADWLYAIAAVENMGPRVAKPDGSFDPSPLAAWQPQFFVKDNEQMSTLVEQLRNRARDENTPRFFDSKLQAAWD